MNERKTKEITTPNGFSVTVKTYCTGFEFEEIQEVYLGGAKVKLVGKTPQIEDISPKVDREARKKMIELLVVRVEGEGLEGGNVVEQVGSMPREDYDAVIDELNTLSGRQQEEDFTSPSQNTEQTA